MTNSGNRNFGIIWAYIIFNGFAAVFLYWLVRVPKGGAGKKEKKLAKKQKGANAGVVVAPAMGEKEAYSQQAQQVQSEESQQVAAMRAAGMTEKEGDVGRNVDGHT